MKTTIINPVHRRDIGASLPGRQRGLTMISWIVVIVFILFQVVMAMNIIPVYLADSSVKAIMEELPEDITARESTAKDLKFLIQKRLRINNIRTVTKDDIVITKGRNEYTVKIDYEPRGKLIGNLDFIVSFSHEVVVPSDR